MKKIKYFMQDKDGYIFNEEGTLDIEEAITDFKKMLVGNIKRIKELTILAEREEREDPKYPSSYRDNINMYKYSFPYSIFKAEVSENGIEKILDDKVISIDYETAEKIKL